MTATDSPLSAILAETSPRLRAQSAALTLRIWHHLASDEARLLLFEPFRAEGRPFPLIEALTSATGSDGQRFSLRLDAAQIRDGTVALGQALGDALADVFGEAARVEIAPAWQQALHYLLDQIAARLEQQRS